MPGPSFTAFTRQLKNVELLASLLILCCNEVGYTRRCLESVLRHTRAPYELVLVDNGSTDDTPAFLEELRGVARPEEGWHALRYSEGRAEPLETPSTPFTSFRACHPSHAVPMRVVVIRNEKNLGFAAGCNQALREARGRYLVFLNNDTVVTSGWLEGLIGWSLHDWPNVGLVGPTSNYAPPPQRVVPEYADLTGLEAFAARRARQFAGQGLTVGRLTGFCLLVRREALKCIGGFDEGYGLGFFEDDDLCVRAQQAGFRLVLARDVYIHHFGSRTFASLGIDGRAQLATGLERFRAKWGSEKAAGYRLPEEPPQGEPRPLPEAGVPASASRPRISLCMIVRNEEENLPACLESAAELVDELVIVDTGSTDHTKEVAARFGAKVFDFPWCDSFAAARNESLKQATGEWAFWLDADDRLDEENRKKLKGLFAALNGDNIGFSMKCRCLPEPGGLSGTVVDHVRLFPNRPEIRWRYRVHEQIIPALRQAGAAVCEAGVFIDHTGYQDPSRRGAKDERNLRLLQMDLAEFPDEPFILFNLGWIYEETKRPAEAIPFLKRSLERSGPGDSIVRKLYAILMECHRQLGRPDEALKVCAEGRRHYPDDEQLLFQEALLHRQQKDLPGAESCLLRLLTGQPESPHFASVVDGLRTYKARHELAVVCHEHGRHAEAEAHWRTVLEEGPQFLPALVGLGELWLVS